jgi:hypothetical protein
MKITVETIKRLWRDFELSAFKLPPEHEKYILCFLRMRLLGTYYSGQEFLFQSARVLSYVRGNEAFLDVWMTPKEWRDYYREELPNTAAVWVQEEGQTRWDLTRYGDIKNNTLGLFDVLVCKGPEPPPNGKWNPGKRYGL